MIEYFVNAQSIVPSHEAGRSRSNGLVPNGGHASEGVLDFVTLASTTEGYSIADLKDLTLAATQQSSIRNLKDNATGVSILTDLLGKQTN